MSLGSVNSNKDLAIGFQPLLLATLTLKDGSILNLSTHPLNEPEGGYNFPGAGDVPAGEYLGRLQAQDIQQLQARSEQGIDRIPSVTLHVADSDKFIWTNFEQTVGIKGARLDLNLVLWEADTGNFTSDAPLKFRGTCDAPSFQDGLDTLVITANAAHNTARVYFPIVPIQPRCPWIFPSNAGQRLDGATNRSSQFWECGYNPDQPGTDPDTGGSCIIGHKTTPNATDASGNPIADDQGIYITCDYTKQACVARGMYTPVSHYGGRFGGVQWSPPKSESQQKQYTSNKSITVFSSRNDSLYGQGFNMLYGEQWVNGQVLNAVSDGNAVKFEVAVCIGFIGDGVQKVIVNNVEIPQNNSDFQFTWRYVNAGNRNGAPNGDTGFDGTGDPYGSIAVIEIVAYHELVGDGSSYPTVRILSKGTRVAVFDSPDDDLKTLGLFYSNNPAWVLMDFLTWANWQYSDFDIQSFIDAANFANTPIAYTDLTGNPSASHARFICEVVVDQRRTAQEVFTAILYGFRSQLLPNNGGLLSLLTRRSLGEQQSGPVQGSNTTNPLLSPQSDGTMVPGYPAYVFDESSIARTKEEGAPMIAMPMLQSSSTPTRILFPFQDSDNTYQTDSMNLVDADAVMRAGGYFGGGGNDIPQNLTVLGISNFDQGIRMANTILAEALRGNEAEDARGTRIFEITSTVKISHLKVGDICLLKYQQLELSPVVPLQGADNSSQDGILVRVLRIQPSTNYTRSKVSLAWHRDEWYEDKFGQNPAPFYSAAGSAGMGLPLPWRPDSEVPHSSLFDATELNFSVAQVYQTLADGTSLAQLQISGRPPVNQLSTGATAAQRPLVERQGLTAATGGSIAGPASGSQSYVIGLCSVDSNGLLSPLSHLINVAIPAGTSTNTLGTGIIFWPPNTAGYRVFAGPDVNHLSFQTGGTGTPDSITLTSLNVASYGPPDPAFDHFQVRAKRNIHAGVFGLAISSLTSGTITFDAESFTTNQWAGYTLSIVGKPNSQANIPIIDLLVVSNDATTLTVGVDPTGLGVEAGDVAIMRTKPDTHTATTIGDSNFVNSVDYFDPPYTILGASDESPIIIETDSDPGYITAQSVVVDGVLGNTAANGLWNSITKIDSTHYSLDGSTGSGEYSGGGTVRAFTEGLVANQEVGHLVRIIAGTGRGQSPRRIISNTQTVLTVDVPFNPIPDSTSVFIIEEASWQYSVDTGKITSSNPNPGTPALVATVNVDNLEHQTVLVQVVTEDANDDVSIQNAAPIRELFLFGAPGSDSKKFEKATFNIAVSKDLEVGNLDDVPVYVVKQGGTPGISITTIPKMPPVGAAAILDIIQTPANGSYAPTSIFASGGITIPDGSPNTIIQANFRTGIVFAENDRLSPKCTQVGSTQPGRLISVVVKWDIS